MSEDVRGNIVRGTQSVISNIVVQLDKLNPLEASAYQGADPHFTYRAITIMVPLADTQFIRFRDHLIDQNVIDTVTNVQRIYLIVSDPEMHTIDGHWQWVCTRMRGK